VGGSITGLGIFADDRPKSPGVPNSLLVRIARVWLAPNVIDFTKGWIGPAAGYIVSRSGNSLINSLLAGKIQREFPLLTEDRFCGTASTTRKSVETTAVPRVEDIGDGSES
jgi:hypothetical protein